MKAIRPVATLAAGVLLGAGILQLALGLLY